MGKMMTSTVRKQSNGKTGAQLGQAAWDRKMQAINTDIIIYGRLGDAKKLAKAEAKKAALMEQDPRAE